MRQLKISRRITERGSQSLDRYLNEVAKYPLLNPKEEEEVAMQAARGSKIARDRLVKANLRFVVSVAKIYDRSDLSLDDLINEGNIGLIKAAELFDPTRGFKFISYAVWWIRQSIMAYVTESGCQIRRPQSTMNVRAKLERAKRKAYAQGEIVNEEDFLEQLGFSEGQKKAYRMSSVIAVRGDAPLTEDGNDTVFDRLLSKDNPLEGINTQDRHNVLMRTLKQSLNERELEVVKRYFGLGRPPETIDEIGMKSNLTRERVRQICAKALEKLKTPKCKQALREFL